MSKLLAKDEVAQFQAGIFPDVEQENAPLIRYAENTVFEATGIRPVEGQVLRTIAPVGNTPVLGMNSQEIGQEEWLFWGNKSSLYGFSWPSGGINEWGGYELDPLENFWSITSWGTWTLAASGIGEIQLRKGNATDFNDLGGGSPNNAYLLVRRSPFLVAFSPGNLLDWCDVDDVEVWAPAPENLAGGLVIRDADSETTAAFEWRGEVAHLTQNSLHFTSFIGGNDVFGSKLLLKDIGAVGQKAACAVGDLIYGFGHKGFWRSDGVSHQYLMAPAIEEFVLNRLNPDARKRVCVYNDRFNERVVISIPPGISPYPQESYAWSYRYNNWQYIKHGRTCYDAGDVLPVQLLGGPDGGIYEQTQVATPPGNANVTQPMFLRSTWTFIQGYGTGRYGRGPYGGRYVIR